jgi:alpha-tubulin suppressor-like RCC1 family protein
MKKSYFKDSSGAVAILPVNKNLTKVGVSRSIGLRFRVIYIVAIAILALSILSVPGQTATIASGYHHSLALNFDGTVVAWGRNQYGQSNVPAGLTNVVAVSAGVYHSLALKSDGTVVAWEGNDFGQSDVPAGLTNVVAVSAGQYNNLALKSDGTVVAWGANVQSDVPAGLTNVVAVSAGLYHSLALKSDGCMVAWGSNIDGQCDVPACPKTTPPIISPIIYLLILSE